MCYMRVKDYGWKVDNFQWNEKVKLVKTYLDLLKTQTYNVGEVDIGDEETEII